MTSTPRLSRALSPVYALLLGVAILLTGSGLLGVLVPVRANLQGFSAIEIGLLGSCYYLGFGLGCLLGTRLIATVGHIRAFTAMTAITSAAVIAHGLVVVPAAWWLLRICAGFCFAVLYTVIESWLNERSTQQTRGSVLSAYMVINLASLTLGQMVLLLGDPKGLELFAMVAVFVSLAAVPVSLSRSESPALITTTKVQIRKLFYTSPAGASTCLAVGLVIGAFWALAPRFASSSGFSDSGIALFMSASVFGGALGHLPLGWLSDRMDRRSVILLAAILAALAGALLTSNVFVSQPALLAIGAAWGAFSFPLYSLGVAHTNDHADPPEFVETSAGLLLVFAAGAVAGPLVASAVLAIFDASLLYAYAASVHVMLGLFLVWRMRFEEAVPEQDRIQFSDALQAAMTVSPVFDEQTQDELEEAAEINEQQAAP